MFSTGRFYVCLMLLCSESEDEFCFITNVDATFSIHEQQHKHDCLTCRTVCLHTVDLTKQTQL